MSEEQKVITEVIDVVAEMPSTKKTNVVGKIISEMEAEFIVFFFIAMGVAFIFFITGFALGWALM